MTNTDCTVNPAFCNWSVAYMYYCDGVSFSGDNEAPVEVPGAKVSPIYFRGKRIMDANIASLIATKGLGDADAVVLSGHSAGGLATYLHADYVRKQLPPALPFYAAVPDAG
jgi:dienelactone hydrolase